MVEDIQRPWSTLWTYYDTLIHSELYRL
jgi:hypothetical protein